VLLDWHDRNLVVDSIAALPHHLPEVDVVINCVLWPKERTDHLITRRMLGDMQPGALIVDISCDTAGAVETAGPRTGAIRSMSSTGCGTSASTISPGRYL